MAVSAAAEILAEQKAQLDEVAELTLQIYETLADLRYINREGIIKGPHDIKELRNVYAKHKLDPAIIYLYSILPYIDHSLAEEKDFFHGGTFVDFRNPEDVEQGRDPMYMSPSGSGFDDLDGQYMRPWATPLSAMGNHQSVILYDARQHRIWILDQEGWDTTDRALCNYRRDDDEESEESENSDWGGDTDDGSFQEDEDSTNDSDGSSEYGEDETPLEAEELAGLRDDQAEDLTYDEGFDVLDEHDVRQALHEGRSKNENSFEHIRSRPAGDVLRDIKRWYYELKEMPGQGEHHSDLWMEPSTLRPLYRQNGWPDNFNGDAFRISQVRAYCARRAKYFAEEPLRQVECYNGWLEYNHHDMQRYTKDVADAKTTDEEWVARFKLWQVKQTQERNRKELKDRKEKAERRCPGGKCQNKEDLPLWELQQLRVETGWKLNSVKRSEEASESSDDPVMQKFHLSRFRADKEKAEIYTKALKAAEADAERLCPGRTFQQATGMDSTYERQDTKASIESHTYWMEWARKEVAKHKDWATQLPENVQEARKLVDAAIEQNEKSMENSKKMLESSEKWLAEHGNND